MENIVTKLYLAANHVSITGSLDFGHLQVVRDKGAFFEFEELEAYGSVSVVQGNLVVQGELQYSPSVQPHFGSTTPGTSANATWDPQVYTYNALNLLPNQDADGVWSLMVQLRDWLAKGSFGIDYLFNQNSNSFVYTLLSVVGLAPQVTISDYYIADGQGGYGGISSFPGWGNNLFDGVQSSSASFERIPLKLDGTDGNDYIKAGIGDDTLSGGNGNDTIFGGEGLDQINGGNGSDYIDGGAGSNDVALYLGTLVSEISVVRQANGDVEVFSKNEGTDTLSGIEYLNIGGSTKTVDQWITDLTQVAQPSLSTSSPTPAPVDTPTTSEDKTLAPSIPVSIPPTPTVPQDSPTVLVNHVVTPATPPPSIFPDSIFSDLPPTLATPTQSYSGNVLADTLNIFVENSSPSVTQFGSLIDLYDGADEFVFDLIKSIRTSTMDFDLITSSANFDSKMDVFLDSLDTYGYSDFTHLDEITQFATDSWLMSHGL